jgi:hypothetical protein
MHLKPIEASVTRRRVAWLAVAVLAPAALAFGGCFDDGSGVVVRTGTIVRGKIEQGLTEPAGPAVAPVGLVDTDPRGPAAQSAADATTAEAVEIGADGTLETLVSTDVDAAASYRLDEVPAGRVGLQVIAYTSAGVEVGRVQIHGETEAHGEIAVAPIVPETTVEGHVAAHLRASSQALPAANTGGVSVFIRMGTDEAGEVVASEARVTLVADAFAAWHAYGDAAAGQVVEEYDADTRVRLLTDAATAFDTSRHDGTSLVEAHEALEEAALDAGLEAGAGAEALVLVTAAEATGAAAAAADVADPDEGGLVARLAVVRQVVRLNLRARERLAAGVGDEAPGASASEAATALASAGADVDAATTLAEILTALNAAASACETALFDGFVSVTGELDAELEQQVRASLAGALSEADLAGRLAAATSANDAAAVLVDYRSAVDEAVESLLLLLPATIDPGAVASLLMASNGNGALFATP